jgi:eukaryotic-like serine/threonine-protein kinase
MARHRRPRRIGRLVLLVTALAATYGLFAVVAMRVALRAREIPVPKVVGLEFADAGSALEAAGLTLKIDDSHPFSDTVPEGRIASQDPPAGFVVRRGRSVRVWTSAGSRSSVVPNLVGDTERSAQARSTQDGLGVSVAADIRSSDFPADVVVAQDEPAGSRANRVGVVVNRGERAAGYVMPDLIGASSDAALDVLRSHGLRVSVVAQQPYPGVPSGVILRQAPAAGFQVTPDQPISLEVSR